MFAEQGREKWWRLHASRFVLLRAGSGIGGGLDLAEAEQTAIRLGSLHSDETADAWLLAGRIALAAAAATTPTGCSRPPPAPPAARWPRVRPCRGLARRGAAGTGGRGPAAAAYRVPARVRPARAAHGHVGRDRAARPGHRARRRTRRSGLRAALNSGKPRLLFGVERTLACRRACRAAAAARRRPRAAEPARRAQGRDQPPGPGAGRRQARLGPATRAARPGGRDPRPLPAHGAAARAPDRAPDRTASAAHAGTAGREGTGARHRMASPSWTPPSATGGWSSSSPWTATCMCS